MSKDAKRIVACSTQAEVSRAPSVDPQLIKVRDPNGEPMSTALGNAMGVGVRNAGVQQQLTIICERRGFDLYCTPKIEPRKVDPQSRYNVSEYFPTRERRDEICDIFPAICTPPIFAQKKP